MHLLGTILHQVCTICEEHHINYAQEALKRMNSHAHYV
jgi:hypothetical protein